jgi:hypothetical protein
MCVGILPKRKLSPKTLWSHGRAGGFTLVFNTLRLFTKEDLTHRLCFPVVYPPPRERIDFPGERARVKVYFNWQTRRRGGVCQDLHLFLYAVQRRAGGRCCFLRCPPSARTYFSAWMEVRRNDRSTQKHPPDSAVKQNKLSETLRKQLLKLTQFLTLKKCMKYVNEIGFVKKRVWCLVHKFI